MLTANVSAYGYADMFMFCVNKLVKCLGFYVEWVDPRGRLSLSSFASCSFSTQLESAINGVFVCLVDFPFTQLFSYNSVITASVYGLLQRWALWATFVVFLFLTGSPLQLYLNDWEILYLRCSCFSTFFKQFLSLFLKAS